MTPALVTVAEVCEMPFRRRSKIHGLDIRVSWPTRILPPSFSPTAWPMATSAGAFNGNAPARDRMPSVPNSFVFVINAGLFFEFPRGRPQARDAAGESADREHLNRRLVRCAFASDQDGWERWQSTRACLSGFPVLPLRPCSDSPLPSSHDVSVATTIQSITARIREISFKCQL